jgi:hypothetical protein
MGNPRQQRILFQKKYLYSIHTGFGAHPAYQMGTGALSLGIKWQGHEAGFSPLSSAEGKNGGAIPPLPHMSSWQSA